MNNESAIKPIAQSYLRQLIKLRVMLVVDEVHDFRSPSSKRSRFARQLAKHCKYIRILTGTNNGNCPLGNWAQFEILQKGALGYEKYGDFEKHYADVGYERKILMTVSGIRWAVDGRMPLGVNIQCWSPEHAERWFINEFQILNHDRNMGV